MRMLLPGRGILGHAVRLLQRRLIACDNIKENFTPVDTHAISAKGATPAAERVGLYGSEWKLRHIGPMAQDS